MNFESLNKMIDYIEMNLSSEIDFKQLSKITNTNIFILERIFMFLTNMTITEYIKKRRLSKAFEDIKNTNQKIIDIAVKYQYNSATSFNRAFKQLFNMTPRECRKGTKSYQIIPILYFEPNNQEYKFDYEIKKLDERTLYCYYITASNYSDYLYEIRRLYRKIKENGHYERFNEVGMYGIFLKTNNCYHYYLGSTEKIPNLEKYTILKGSYVSFKLYSKEQKDIIDFEKLIDKRWCPSTEYDVLDNIKIELYKDDGCMILLPLE